MNSMKLCCGIARRHRWSSRLVGPEREGEAKRRRHDGARGKHREGWQKRTESVRRHTGWRPDRPVRRCSATDRLGADSREQRHISAQTSARWVSYGCCTAVMGGLGDARTSRDGDDWDEWGLGAQTADGVSSPAASAVTRGGARRRERSGRSTSPNCEVARESTPWQGLTKDLARGLAPSEGDPPSFPPRLYHVRKGPSTSPHCFPNVGKVAVKDSAPTSPHCFPNVGKVAVKDSEVGVTPRASASMGAIIQMSTFMSSSTRQTGLEAQRTPRERRPCPIVEMAGPHGPGPGGTGCCADLGSQNSLRRLEKSAILRERRYVGEGPSGRARRRDVAAKGATSRPAARTKCQRVGVSAKSVKAPTYAHYEPNWGSQRHLTIFSPCL